MDYNQWAKEMNVGAYYVPPTPPASGHYFNASVYKMKKQKLGIMKRLLKLLGFFLFTLIMSSCARTYSPYKAANTGGLKCSKWNRIK